MGTGGCCAAAWPRLSRRRSSAPLPALASRICSLPSDPALEDGAPPQAVTSRTVTRPRSPRLRVAGLAIQAFCAVTSRVRVGGFCVGPMGGRAGLPFKECCDLTSPRRVPPPRAAAAGLSASSGALVREARSPLEPPTAATSLRRAPRRSGSARPAGPARCPQTGLSSSGEVW